MDVAPRRGAEFASGTGDPADLSYPLISIGEVNLTDKTAHPAILVIDDDLGICETLSCALRSEGFRVETAPSGGAGIKIAQSRAFDLALVDLCLPDMLGTDMVRALRTEGSEVPFVLLSGFLTIDAAVEAMKLGALEVVQKPLLVDDALILVRSALERVNLSSHLPTCSLVAPHTSGNLPPTPAPVITSPRSAAGRWATFVLRACDSEGDLKTLDDWARFVGVSYSSLCESCRLVGVRPHDARDLTRVLRAIVRSGSRHRRPTALLDIRDRRTLKNLLERAGFDWGFQRRPPSAAEFLRRQTFVAVDNEGLIALCELVCARFQQFQQ